MTKYAIIATVRPSKYTINPNQLIFIVKFSPIASRYNHAKQMKAAELDGEKVYKNVQAYKLEKI